MILINIKNILATIFLFFLSTVLYAQDVIFLNNGQRIKVKVIEKTDTEIKYRNYSHQDGPVYSLKIEKINRIVYEEGGIEQMVEKPKSGIEIELEAGKLSTKKGLFGWRYYNNSERISKNGFLLKLRENELAHQKFEEGKNLKTIGGIMGFPSGLVFGYNLGTMLRGGKTSREVNIISGTVWVASLILEITGSAQMRKGLNEFNASQNLGYQLKLDNNSIGISFSF